VSNLVVDKLLQYLYTGDYTSIPNKDCENLDISASQLHARVFALADKYDVQGLCDLATAKYRSRLESDFDVVELLESIPDVYSTPCEVHALRALVTIYARNGLEKALHDSSYTKIYDQITSQVPTFTKDLLDSYIASPILADCQNCGPTRPMQVLQAKCRKCGRGK
jgi:hypothetical protein